MTDRKRRMMYVAVMGGSQNRKNGTPPEHTGCPVHKALRDMALDAITEPNGQGYFRKDTLLKNFQFQEGGPVHDMTHMADSIMWDYVVRNLTEEHGAELIPLAEHFFSKVAKDQERALRKDLEEATKSAQETGDWEKAHKLASRSIASGHGKKTAGYAQFTHSNGLLVLARLKQTRARAAGVEASAKRQEVIAEDRQITTPASPQLVNKSNLQSA